MVRGRCGGRAARRVRVGVVVLVVVLVGVLGGVVGSGAVPLAAAAAPPTLTVTTTADVVDPTDGLLSLREAVTEANQSDSDTSILFSVSEAVELTRCAAGTADEDGNDTGDLDITGTVAVHVLGPALVSQTCPGQRVVDALEGSAGVNLEQLTLGGGNGLPGVAVESRRPLRLDFTSVSGAVAPACCDPESEMAAAVLIAGSTGADLDLAGADIRDTRGAAAVADLVTGGGTFTANSVSITGNALAADPGDVAAGPLAAGIVAGGRPVVITNSRILANNASGEPFPPVAPFDASAAAGAVAMVTNDPEPPLLTIHSTVITGNAGGMVGAVSAPVMAITSSTITGNIGAAVGGLQGHVVVEDSAILDNVGEVATGGVEGSGRITRTTVARNRGWNAGGVGFRGDLRVESSTVADNEGGLAGGVMMAGVPPEADSLVVERSTIAGNRVSTRTVAPPMRARELYVGSDVAGLPSITVVASILGDVGPEGAPPVCAWAAPVLPSADLTIVADDSCSFEGSRVVEGVDPGLGPLETEPVSGRLIRYPGGDSVVRDLIPTSDPSCPGNDTDQRGQARPQGLRCDVGAVEARLGGFHPSTPSRVHDTRVDGGPLGPGEVRSVHLYQPSFARRVAAVVVNVTVTNSDHASHLTVFPAGRPAPATSTLNWPAGATIANTTTVAIDATTGDIAVRNNEGHVQVIVDLAGYYDDGMAQTSESAAFHPVGPSRKLDTRSGLGGTGATPIGPGEVRRLDLVTFGGIVPEGATAVAVNLTGVLPTEGTHLTVGPSGQVLPDVSNLNLPAGAVSANFAVVRLGEGGALSIRNNSGSMHVLVDVVGYYRVDDGARFRALSPVRLYDSRTAGVAFGPGWSIDLPVNVALEAVVINLTGTQTSETTHITAWPTGQSMPDVSNLNLAAGETRANMAIVGVGPQQSMHLRNNSGQVHLIVDVAGWFV